MKLDYKKLTMDEMMNYIKENHNDTTSKKAFAAAAVKDHKEQCYTTVLDANGQPVMVEDKNGNLKPKKQRVDKANGKTVKVKSVLDAKKYFYETYKNEIDFVNAPKTKAEDAQLSELLSW